MPKWFVITLIVIVIMILLVVITSTIANVRFEQNAKKEVKQLFIGSPKNDFEKIQKEDLAHLPQPVQIWLENAHIIGKEKISSVRLKQKGRMRTKVDGPWMPAEAEQYFNVDEPKFVWKAKVQMSPLLKLSGLDHYSEGKGKMTIKVLSLIPVVDSEGPEMDQSTLLRYMAEMPWFPTAALNPYIKWEPIDTHSARATMSYKGVTASGVFTFNDKGDLIRFKTKRYKEENGKYELRDWGGINKEFKEFNGIRIPNKSDIVWFEESGDFNWYQLEITDLEYNKPQLY